MALTDAAQQNRAAAEVLTRQLSVRDTEKLVSDIKKPPAPKKKKAAADDPVRLHLRAVEDKLRRVLATRVTLEGGAGQGKIVIRYHNADERERLIEQLLRSDS